MALTRITKGVIKPNENYDTHNINSTGIVTAIGLDVNGNGDISGNLSVGGVLTYEDVTSIDSVGIITAQKDIHVGAGVSAVGVGTFGSLDISGDIDVDGHTNLDNVSIAGVTTVTNNYFDFKPANGGNAHFRMLSTGTGDAGIFFDAANGDIAGSDYVFIGQKNNLDFVINPNANAGNIDFQRAGTTQVRIAGNGNVSLYKDLDVDGHTNLDNVSVAGITTFSDDVKYTVANGSGILLDKSASQFNVNSGTIVRFQNNNEINTDDGKIGTALFASGLNIVGSQTGSGLGRQIRLFGDLLTNNIKPTADSTHSIGTSSNRFLHAYLDNIDVDGHTNLDNVSIAGVTTVTTFLQVLGQAGTSDKGFEVRANSTQNTDTNKAIRIRNNSNTDTFNISYKGKVTATELDISGNIDVDGHTNLDNVNIVGIATISSNLVVSGQIFQSRPTDFWSSTSSFFEIAGLGNFTTQGSYETTLTSNGYRDTNGQWVGYSAGSNGGAAQIRLNPQGQIIFGAESSKSNGSTHVVTERLRIDQEGIRSPGGTFNIRNNSSTGNVTINVLGVSGDSRIDLENTGNGNYSGIDFIRERSSGTGVAGGSIFMKSDTSSNNALMYIQAQSASAQSPVTSALGAGNGVRLKLQGGQGIFAIETGASERLRIDSSGRIGVGVVPTAQFNHNLIQIGNQATLGANAALSVTGQTFLTHNLYFDPSGNYQVFNTSNANEGTILRMVDGNFTFSNSAATTGTPTVIERLRIASDGKVLIGTNSSPDTKLQITNGTLKIETHTTFYSGSGENGENYPTIFLNADHSSGNNPAHGKISVRHSNQNTYSGDIVLMPQGYYGSYGYQEVLRVSAYKRVGINKGGDPGHTLDVYNEDGSDCLRLDTNASASGSNKQNAIRFSTSGTVRAHVGVAVDAGRLMNHSASNDFCVKTNTANSKILVGAEGNEIFRISKELVQTRTLSGGYYPVVSARDGSSSSRAATSAWEIKKTLGPRAKTGYYYLKNPYDDTVSQWWCDMTTDGGGWILVAHVGDGGMSSQSTADGNHWWNRSHKGGFDTVGSGYYKGGGYWRTSGGAWAENTCGQLMWDVRTQDSQYDNYSNAKVVFNWGTDQALPTGGSGYSNIPNAGNRRFNEWCYEVVGAPGFNPSNYHQNERSNTINGGNHFTEHMAMTWCFRGTGGGADDGDSGPYWMIGSHHDGLHQHYEESLSGGDGVYGDGGYYVVSNEDTGWGGGGSNGGYPRIGRHTNTGVCNIWLR